MQFYSIPHNTWQTMPPLPRPLNHVNVAVNGGKIYALGGLADAADGSPAWEAVSDSWVYDPRKKIWTSIAPVPEDEKRGSAGMGVYKDLIILAGGMRVLELAGDQLQDTVDIVSIYDTAKGTWLAVPAAAKHLPEGRDHAGAAVIGDKFYILGGRNHGQHNVKDTVFILDLRNISAGWKTSKAKMPTPRGGLAAGVIGTKVYTFGGEGNVEAASGVYNETEVYDSVRDEWRKLAPMKIPRHGTSAVGVGGRVFIPGGGVLIGAGPVSDFDVFMP
jgi:N-acetylneuraminic acid mutarotase